MITMSIAGAENIERNLALRQEEILEKAEVIIEQIAIAIKQDASELVPKDSGKLASSIAVIKEEGVIRLDVASPYAAEIEFGTTLRAATPFLIPAIDKNRIHQGGI